ncbi:DedA family protein [Rhodobacterales bacterium HKCCE2091]|nr:DedA family protein [Rhodobacterales bacterium HKCCE2091]
MTETLLALVPSYGLVVLAVATFLSCLALPVPTSLIMLSAGGFAASGDLVLWQAALAAFAGAVLGDQAGYRIGAWGGEALTARLRSPARARLYDRAASELRRRGPLAVFLSRWLVSPLGPYVNFAAGAAGLRRARFTWPAVAGEAVWVAIYIGLGAAFTGDLVALAGLLGNAGAFLAALIGAAVLFLWLRAALRARRRAATAEDTCSAPLQG